MTDKQFLKRMIVLTEKLCDVYNVEPLDQGAREAIRLEIFQTGEDFSRSRRRRPWIMFAILIFVCLVFAWIVYDILFYL